MALQEASEAYLVSLFEGTSGFSSHLFSISIANVISSLRLRCRHQPLCHSRQASYHPAQGHATRSKAPRREGLGHRLIAALLSHIFSFSPPSHDFSIPRHHHPLNRPNTALHLTSLFLTTFLPTAQPCLTRPLRNPDPDQVHQSPESLVGGDTWPESTASIIPFHIRPSSTALYSSDPLSHLRDYCIHSTMIFYGMTTSPFFLLLCFGSLSLLSVFTSLL